jgi:hypothetical protein
MSVYKTVGVPWRTLGFPLGVRSTLLTLLNKSEIDSED